MDQTLLWVALAGVVVLALGIIGALSRRADAEARERAREEREKGRLAQRGKRVARTAFNPAHWWEFGKAREQAEYFAAIRSAGGGASPTSVHALCRVHDGEQRRQKFRRATGLGLVLIGAVVGAGLLLAPTTTAKLFELFGEPALWVAVGVGLFMFGMSDRIQKGVGTASNILAAVVLFGGLAVGIVGLALAVWAGFSW